MRAIQFSRFGGPEVLELVDLPRPVAGPGEALVRVRAAGINFFETLMRQDRYAVTPELPFVPGVEVAGVVEGTGRGVTADLLGKRVGVPLFALGRPSGGYADYVAVAADGLVPLPDDLSFEDATALMVQGLTADYLLRVSPPTSKKVLVNAAAGGVGSLLVQLALRAGADLVIAAASTPEKLERARSLGAQAGVDYTKPGWVEHVREASGGTGADMIYESVGGAITMASLDALAPRGEIVIYGALNIQAFSLGVLELKAMIFKNLSVRGFALQPLLARETLHHDLARLFELAAKGELRVLQGGRFGLEQAAEAHAALEGRQTTGKIVLAP